VDADARLTNGVEADGEVVWSWRPDAGAKLRSATRYEAALGEDSEEAFHSVEPTGRTCAGHGRNYKQEHRGESSGGHCGVCSQLAGQRSYSISAATHVACFSSGPSCIVSENEVVSFGRLVAAEAGFVQCLVARFSVLKVTEPPAARRGVLF
jgi:hypothetical protein